MNLPSVGAIYATIFVNFPYRLMTCDWMKGFEQWVGIEAVGFSLLLWRLSFYHGLIGRSGWSDFYGSHHGSLAGHPILVADATTKNYDERKRKVKNEEQWENRTSTYEPFRDDTRRRIIRTADGEFMTAIEDPATGMLILEERESNKS